MIKAEIRRPTMDDMKELHAFFKHAITDTFNKEEISEKSGDLKGEIEDKKKYLASDLESDGEKRYFLIAVYGGQIIGSIEYGPASSLICKITNDAFKELVEVGTVYVHPDYQRMGVGNMLLTKMYDALRSKGIEEFCLDSGYKVAQQIWTKKFGEPAYLIKDYWDKGFDHMIWRVKVSD